MRSIRFNRKRSAMKRVEPAFDPAAEFCSADVPQTDVEVLENTITKQSSELNFRLTEVLELYNIQTRQTEELQAAHEEIHRLKQAISELRKVATQQTVAAAIKQDEINRLESDRAALSRQRALAFLETETLENRMNAMQTTLAAGEANVASALSQIDHLNSELAAAAAERFKLVATVYSEKRRYNQQTSFWEDKIKNTEAKAANREMQVKNLEDIRRKLDTRIKVLEALRESERQAAERKTGQLTEELKHYQLSGT